MQFSYKFIVSALFLSFFPLTVTQEQVTEVVTIKGSPAPKKTAQKPKTPEQIAMAQAQNPEIVVEEPKEEPVTVTIPSAIAPVESTENTLKDLTKTVDALKKQVSSLENQLNSARNEISRLNDENTRIKSELIALNNSVNHQFGQLPGIVDEIGRNMDNLSQEVIGLRRNYESFQTQYVQPIVTPRFGNFPPDVSPISQRAFEH